MAANNQSAMFWFDTNIDAVAANIAASMERINATLAQPLTTPQLATTTAGLGQLESRMGTELEQSVRRMQELIRSGISPDQFKTKFADMVRNDLARIPQIMANEIGLMPQAAAANAPVNALAKGAGQSFIRTLRDTIRAEAPQLADAVKNVRFTRDVNTLYNAPAAFGQENSVRATLQNQLRAENILRRDPTFGSDAKLEADRAGFSDTYMRDLKDRYTTPTDNGRKWLGSNTQDLLTEINRLESIHETTARNSGRAMETEAQAARELATALGLVAAEQKGLATRVGGRIALQVPSTTGTGVEYYRTTTHGAVQEENPLQISKAEQAVEKAQRDLDEKSRELKNAQDIVAAQATQSTKTVGNRHKVGGTHYRPTASGATEVTHPLEIARAEEALDEAATTLRRKQQELADAQAMAAASVPKTGGVRSVGIGDHYKDTREGVTKVTNPVQVEDADQALRRIAEEQANEQRLVQNWGSMVPVGPYRVLGQEVYKLTEHGAKLVSQDLQVLEALVGQDRVLAAQLEKAQRLAQITQRRALKEHADQGGFSEGFANRFNRGDGSLTNTLGAQIASAASFSIGYGALFAAQGAIRDTINEYMDYQDSLTDLQIATRSADVVTGEWVNRLGDLARVTGENVGAALDTAARGVRAFGDPLSSTVEELQSIGEAANSAATQLALVAEKSLTDATGDTIAIGTAFGFEPDQLNQIVDAVANAKRTLGGDPTQIAQGLASIGSSAVSAGYDVNQAAALISLVQARTDESGQAAATRLTRIFQVVSGTTGKKLGQELGVDTDQSARQQLERYYEIYNDPNSSKAVKDRITSSLGGTANLRELLPILTEGDRLMEAYGEANRNAGQGTDEFTRKSDSLVGTLKKISGDVKAIQRDLVETDLFAPFGILVNTLEPVLHLLDRMLQIFNGLPDPIQKTVAGMIDLAIAAKAVAVVQSLGGARQAVKDAAAAATANMGGSLISGGATGLASQAAAQGVTGKVGMMGGLRAIGAFAINPATIAAATAVGAAVVANKMMDASEQRRNFTDKFADTGEALTRSDGSAASLRQSATDLRAVAGELAKSDTAGSGTREMRDELVGTLRTQRRELEGIARRVAAEQRRNAVRSAPGTFGEGGVVTTVNELASGMDALTSSGATATGAMRALADALENTATPTSGQRYNPAQFAGNLSTGAVGMLRDALPERLQQKLSEAQLERARRSMVGYNPASGFGTFESNTNIGTVDRDDAYATLRAANGPKAIDAAIRKASQQLGFQNGQVLTADQETQLARAAADAFDLTSIPEQAAFVRSNLFNMLMDDMGHGTTSRMPKGWWTPQQSNAPQELLNGRGRLNEDQIMTLLNPSEDGSWQGLAAYQQASLSMIPASDDGTGKIRALRTNLRALRGLQRRSGGKVPELNREVANAEDAYIGARIDRINDIRRAAQNDAMGNKKKVRQIGQDKLEQLIALAGTNGARLRQIMEDADQKALDLVRAHLAEAARTADAAAAAAVVQPVPANPTIAVDPVKPKGKTPEREALEEFDKQAGVANVPDKDGVYSSGSDAANYEAPEKASEKDRLTAAQRAARRAQALRNPRDTTGAARDALRVAEANLAAIKDKNSDEYFSALQEVTQSQNALADSLASRSAAFIAAEVARAGGGALASAKGQIDSARIDLASQVPGTEGYANALASLYSGQNAMREAHASDISAEASIGAAQAGGGQMASARAAVNAARARLDAQVKGTVEWKEALAGYYEAQNGMRDAVASRSTSIAQATAARQHGPIAAARAQLVAARVAMSVAAQGTAEWFQGLASFYEAQWAMRDAVLQYKNNVDLLRGDSTDPVEQARDALRAAVRKLRADRNNGAGKAVQAEDRVATQDAENALRGAKFEQRMNDMQTAEDLGRISFSKYMNYLDHEHDRLSRIRHRTRQQQDQLDSVDKAMKEALSSMDSQFNLGDINTNGLVYQVRRFQAEARHNAASAQLSNNTHIQQTVTIGINGADVAKVKSIIDTYLNVNPHGQTRTLTRRKI